MKQSKTTLKELTAMYRAVLRHGILCNAIALGLVAMPAMASPAYTDGNAWVFGDAAFSNQSVVNGEAAFGGRRLADSDPDNHPGKYHNVFPEYQMVGQSFALNNSDAYFGPITLTLGNLDNLDVENKFVFNWQAPDDDPNYAGENKDVDIAALANIGWNEDFATIGQKLTTAMTTIFSDLGYTGSTLEAKVSEAVNGAAGAVYMMSRKDTDASNDGALALNNVDAVVDGSTITANAISVTNGSKLTFASQDTDRLNTSSNFYTNVADIDSDGKTTLNADTITIDNSRMVVNAGAELTINPTTNATISGSSYTGHGGAIANNGTLNLNGTRTATENPDEYAYNINVAGNSATGKGGAIYGDNVNSLINITGTKFSGNHADSNAGGAMYLYRGTADIDQSEFANNSATWGGAIYTKAGGTSDLTITNSRFVGNTASEVGAVGILRKGVITNTDFIGNVATNTDVNAEDEGGSGALFLGSESYTTITGGTFADNESGTRGGAIGTRRFKEGVNTAAKLDINGTTFTGNSATVNGGAIDNFLYNDADNDGYVKVTDATFAENSAANGGAIYNHKGQVGDKLTDNTTQTSESDPSKIQTGNMYIADTTFTGNTASDKGGAIYNEGSLTLNHATFGGAGEGEGNTATDQGGAIYSTGALTLNNSTFTNNSSTGGDGGAIVLNSDTVPAVSSITNSTFTNNKAVGYSQADSGAISVINSDLTISGSTFSGNEAKTGGALYAYMGNKGNDANPDSYVKVDISNSEFIGNKATGNHNANSGGGAIGNVAKNFRNDGDAGMWISNTLFEGNENTVDNVNGGGAIFAGSDSRTNITNNTRFIDNTSASSGGAIGTRNFTLGTNTNAVMDIIGSTFKGNTATTTGGAIDNYLYGSDTHVGSVYIANTTFGGAEEGDGNSAANGGAIYNHKGATQTGNMYITDTTFAGNGASATGNGGAIYNEGTLTLNDVTFGGDTAGSGNTARYGGAIYNTGTLTFDGDVSFLNNDTVSIANSKGAAIYNVDGAEITFDGDATFTGNKSKIGGGAIWNDGKVTFDEDSTYLFSGNSSRDSNGGGAISNGTTGDITITAKTTFDNNYAGTTSTQYGGAIYSNGDLAVNGTSTDRVMFSNNTAKMGGAIYNDRDGETTIENAVFDSNNVITYSGAGGAITNRNTATIIDSDFVNNKASAANGGAIYNYAGAGSTLSTPVLTIKAVGSDVLFDNNKAHYGSASEFANDITNRGVDGTHTATLNLNAANGKSITLNGGITGYAAAKAYSMVNINNDGTSTGTINIAGDLKHQTVAHNAGELHLTTSATDGSNVAGSTIAVASGATINTIDNVFNDYSNVISLVSGSKIALDADFDGAGASDKYKVTDDDQTIYVTGFNMLGSGIAEKSLTVAFADSETGKGNVDVDAVKDRVKAYTSSATFGLEGNESDNGTISLVQTAATGGLSLAADDSSVREQVYYEVTDDETLSESKTLQHNFTLTGNGTGASDKEVELAGLTNLTVGDGSTATINDLKLVGTGTLNNAATASLTINNSLVDVKLRNAGILYSDPTTYSDTLTNTGIANITGDTFAATGVLENYNIANLSQDGADKVTFESGATITGTGTTNIVSGQAIFNNTVNTNTVKVASNADFDGALVGGTLNTHNGTIDTITGSFSGGDVVLDAKLGSTNTIDTIGGVAGATIKEINILGTEYGTNDSVELTLGTDATLDNNLQINGMNYYTNVAYDETTGKLTLSDKLINTSTLRGTGDGSTTFVGDVVIGDKANTTTVGTANAQLALNDEDSAAEIRSGTEDSGAHVAVDTKTSKKAELAAVDSGYGAGVKVNATNKQAEMFVNDATTEAYVRTLFNGDDAIVNIKGDAINLTGNTAVTGDFAVSGKTTTGSLVLNGSAVMDGIDTAPASGHTTKLITSDAVATALADKQDTLTAGNGITLASNTISAKAGNGTITVDTDGIKVGIITDSNIANGSISQGKINGLTAALEGKVDNTLTINGHALTDNVELDATDVLSSTQQAAVNSGITTELVESYNSVVSAVNDVDTGLAATRTLASTAVQQSSIATTLSNTSTDDQVASAKAVYDALGSLGEMVAGAEGNGAIIAVDATGDNKAQMAADYTNDGHLYSAGVNVNATDRQVEISSQYYADATNTTGPATNEAYIRTNIINDSEHTSVVEMGADNIRLAGNTTVDGALNADSLTIGTTGYGISATGAGSLASLTVGGNDVLTTNSALDGAKLTDASVALAALATTDLSQFDNTAAGFITKDVNNLTNYMTTTEVNSALAGKQDALDATQLAAVNSGITADKVSTYDGYAATIAGKQDAIDVDHKLDATLVNGLSTVATTGNFADLTVADGAIAQSKVNGLTDALNAKADTVDLATLATTAAADATAKANAAQAAAVAAAATDATAKANTAETNAKTYADNVSSSKADNVVTADTDFIAFKNSDGSTEATTYTAAKIDALVSSMGVEQANAYTDARIERLDKDLSAGVAGAVALSSVAVSGVKKGEVSVGAGYGYFNGQSAAAFGAAMGLSKRWSVNAGAGVSNSDVSFRAGTNYKFKLF